MTTTIPFKELMRYEATSDQDYYALMQLYDERDDCYEDLVSMLHDKTLSNDDWIDQSEMTITDIADIDKRIVNIRKKYSRLVKKFN